MIPPNINGERLVMQQITCMASQMWLYGNGRFSSYFLLPKTFADVSLVSLTSHSTVGFSLIWRNSYES